MDEYEQEVISKSGDPGPLHDTNPWATGDMEMIQAVEKAAEAWEHYGRSASLRLSRSIRAREHPPQPSEGMQQNIPSPLSDVVLLSTPPTPQVTEVRQSDLFSILSHLALFGILGVLIRYGLASLFADVLSVTQDGTALYRDLPANVVGSFFMGWVGIVYKRELVSLSEPMAIGLSTGLMGSITTYAGWNQRMVGLVSKGKLASALTGLYVGMAVAQISLQIGIHSAEGSKKLGRFRSVSESGMILPLGYAHLLRVSLSAIVFVAACCLWVAAIILLAKGRSSQDLRALWLACLVAPFGVWLRWVLARLNGGGLLGRHRWLPVGTLSANMIAASLEAVLTLLQFVVTDPTGTMVLEALQLGFLGCLSTVSTFVNEVYSMSVVGVMVKKAYIYSSITLLLGLVFGVLLFSCPAWLKGYVKY